MSLFPNQILQAWEENELSVLVRSTEQGVPVWRFYIQGQSPQPYVLNIDLRAVGLKDLSDRSNHLQGSEATTAIHRGVPGFGCIWICALH